MYMGGFPIISLDQIYIEPNNNIVFLDCTRLDGSSELVSRNNPNDLNSVERQIRLIASSLQEKTIVIADDF